jgi:hypothetical protein
MKSNAAITVNVYAISVNATRVFLGDTANDVTNAVNCASITNIMLPITS